MSIVCRLTLVAAAALALTACADDSGAATPSPFITPTPAGPAAVIYVLTQKMVPGYQRRVNIPLSPAGLASENATPALKDELSGDGFLSGARVEYTPPPNGGTAPLAFRDISSDAIIFGDGRGAGQYFTATRTRLDTATPGASLVPLRGLPRASVDDLVAFQSALPSSGGAVPETAFIALFRHGRVVTQVFARGTSTMTTLDAFLPLVSGQETLLAVSPGI